jgi:hypothetical protein
MKKIIFFITFISFAMTAHAQWIIGGSTEYSSISNKNNFRVSAAFESKLSQSGFSFAPMIGYQINKFAFGGSIIINTDTDTDTWLSGHYQNKTKNETILWGVQPFVRYTFMEFGNFSVFANTGVHILTGNSKQTYSSNIPSTTNSEHGILYMGINVVPVLSYRLSDRINLEAGLNFMNFGWNSVTEEDKRNHSNPQKTTITDFGLGVNSGNAANVGTISIGFIYKFGGKRVL